jgi:hypothetical protein
VTYHDRLGVDPYINQVGRASTRPDTELLASSTANLGDEFGTLICDEPVLQWPVRFRAWSAVDHDRPVMSLNDKRSGCVALRSHGTNA